MIANLLHKSYFWYRHYWYEVVGIPYSRGSINSSSLGSFTPMSCLYVYALKHMELYQTTCKNALYLKYTSIWHLNLSMHPLHYFLFFKMLLFWLCFFVCSIQNSLTNFWDIPRVCKILQNFLKKFREAIIIQVFFISKRTQCNVIQNVIAPRL